jgi:hypothetical protein
LISGLKTTRLYLVNDTPMNKNYKCPTCPCKSQEEPDEWLAGTHCDCPCHLPKKHICDGGDDYGVVDCLQCEKEMIEHLKKSKKSSELNEKTIKQFISSALDRQYTLGLKDGLEKAKSCVPDESPNYARICQNRNGLDYCGTCEQAWEYCSCSARNTGNNRCLQTTLSNIDKLLSEIK